MIRRSIRAAMVLAAALAPATVLAQSPVPQAGAQASPAPVQVQNAWSRATPPHASTGVIYMTLTSPGGDKLIGASSSVATEASVHETQMQDNVMRMRPIVGGLDLPAGKAVSLAPGGYHIMLEGLKAPLHAGQSVPVHLTFEKAPPQDITVQVRAVGRADDHVGQGAMSSMTMEK
jgi:copper(I)-binding protein